MTFLVEQPRGEITGQGRVGRRLVFPCRELDRSRGVLDGILLPAEHEGDCSRRDRVPVGRIKLHGLGVIGDCPLPVTHGQVGVPSVVVSVDVPRLNADDLIVIGDRLVVVPSGIVRDAAIVEEIDGLRFELESRGVVGNRLVQLSLLLVGWARLS